MLRSIELVNFLSHGDNTISLNPGITVFMGHNGSGKSSVIDGIYPYLIYHQTQRTYDQPQTAL